MPDENLLKCPCQKCGGHIQFPNDGVGQIISCPHCGAKTTLFFATDISGDAPPAAVPRRQRTSLAFLVVGVVIIIAAIAIVIGLKKKPAPPTPPPPAPQTNVQVHVPEPPKDWNGLKASTVTLDKSGRLVYAVGRIENSSDHERFGVSVQLDLFDADGGKVGSAKDYVASIQPGKEWKFKALITEKKAARAEIVAVKEK
jgi:hypothetical protein